MGSLEGWTKEHPDGCKICERIDRPHYGQGICSGCIYYARKKGIYQPKRSWKKMRVRNGQEEHRCIACGNWKIADEFYPAKTMSGRTARCKQCKRTADREKYWADPEAQRKRAKERYDKLFSREATKKFMTQELRRRRKDSLNGSAAVVPVELVQPWLAVLMEESRDQTSDGRTDQQIIANWTGISVRRIYDILNPKPGYKTSYDTAERIALRAGKLQELEDVLELPGVEGWSIHGARYCERCGTWERPHVAKNLCGRCYTSFARYRSQGKEMPPFARIDRDMQKFWKKRRS